MKPKRVTTQLSVVAPVYDERECIATFVEEVSSVLATLHRPSEIICVDDGSTDGSRELLVQLKPSHPALRVLALSSHSGKSTAWIAGVRAARGDVIVFIDSDLQNDPTDIPRLLAALDEGADCVSGRRLHREDSWIRLVSSHIANRVRVALTGGPMEDSGCGFKMCRAEVLANIVPFDGMHRFLPTLVRLAGGTVVEIDVAHRPRPAGRPKYGLGLGRTARTLLDTLGVRWLQERRTVAAATEL